MPHTHGKNVVFYILDSSAASQNLTGDGNSLDLTWTADIQELRPFGATSIEKIAGLSDWNMTYSAYWSSETTGVDTILGTIGAGGSTSCSAYFGGTGSARYVGNALLGEYSVSGPSDGPVSVTATFAGSGTLSRT